MGAAVAGSPAAMRAIVSTHLLFIGAHDIRPSSRPAQCRRPAPTATTVYRASVEPYGFENTSADEIKRTTGPQTANGRRWEDERAPEMKEKERIQRLNQRFKHL